MGCNRRGRGSSPKRRPLSNKNENPCPLGDVLPWNATLGMVRLESARGSRIPITSIRKSAAALSKVGAYGGLPVVYHSLRCNHPLGWVGYLCWAQSGALGLAAFWQQKRGQPKESIPPNPRRVMRRTISKPNRTLPVWSTMRGSQGPTQHGSGSGSETGRSIG